MGADSFAPPGLRQSVADLRKSDRNLHRLCPRSPLRIPKRDSLFLGECPIVGADGITRRILTSLRLPDPTSVRPRCFKRSITCPSPFMRAATAFVSRTYFTTVLASLTDAAGGSPSTSHPLRLRFRVQALQVPRRILATIECLLSSAASRGNWDGPAKFPRGPCGSTGCRRQGGCACDGNL